MNKVSVIMPVFNAEKFVGQAINSVLAQTYSDIELIVVDDGSTDRSSEIVKSFSDKRIKHITQSNLGVSAARNAGLNIMTGSFFCFLDADDYFTQKSIEIRISILLKSKDVDFVDGSITIFDDNNIKLNTSWMPRFRGKVNNELLRLSSKCFFGPTWLIRRDPGKHYSFDESIRHGEDLDFFVTISRNGNYDFTEETIVMYRRGTQSAMSNLDGLDIGYQQLFRKWVDLGYISGLSRLELKLRFTKIMSLSYLGNGRVGDAIKAFFKFLAL